MSDELKKILVTGGAGFVGSHLCRLLLSQGHKVICLDNLLTGSLSNIDEIASNKRFEFIEHDIVSSIDLKVDQIYNLACPASPAHYQRDPVETMRTSVLGAINVLELARRVGATVLQASTSEVYGDPEMHPQKEAYWGHVNPVGLRACYDEGKRCAETLFMDYHRQYGVSTRIVRIFNTYGPYMSMGDGRVVSNFVVQSLTDEDITIYGNGSQTRSFQFVDDLVRGMQLMMNQALFIGPVNIGNPVEFTILELAKLILEKLPNSKSKVVFKDLPSDDPRQRRPDICLAKKFLGWKPEVSLEDGLDATIRYFSSAIVRDREKKR